MIKTCLTCHNKFNTPRSKIRFCTNSCWLIYKKENRLGLKKDYSWSDESKAKASASQKKRFAITNSWNKGKKLPERSGSNHHFWNKIRSEMRGENNPNWRGGVTTEQQKARTSQEHKHWRKAVFERDDYTCQICAAYGVYLHADHLKSFAHNVDLRYDTNNGRTLCKDCHYQVTFNRPIPDKHLPFGVNKRNFVQA